jgi:C1A family cysteine protease
MAFDYIKANKGIDSEDDYPFTASNGECWKTAEKRVVAQIDAFTAVTAGSEEALVTAAALGPVSVAIEADQPAFQHYKSGVFDAPCGTKLDHGVLVVGYDADTYTVKNRHEMRPLPYSLSVSPLPPSHPPSWVSAVSPWQ